MISKEESVTSAPAIRRIKEETRVLKRGHALSYTGLFLFTAVLYFRPYELIPGLSSFTSMAYWIGALTLAVFFVSQISLEGTLTARPREVNLVLLLCVTALLSIPLAISPIEAWGTFNDSFIKAVLIFIVTVNAVRTERRLKGLLLLALGVSYVLSIAACNDYRLGRLTVEGTRVSGIIQGLFANPNDLALHLVTMVPIAAGLFLVARHPLAKILYGAGVFLMVTAIMLTFSRGGFLGLAVVGATLAWKLGRRNRFVIAVSTLVIVGLILVFSPGGYSTRLSSIVEHNLDPLGSAGARVALLYQSIFVALRHPLFGIGMGNYHIVSIREHVSHNSYTQVAAEMGLTACVIYVMFIISPLRRLREMERETLAYPDRLRFYYLAVALQASLIGYLVCSFFASVAYLWYIYYLVGYAVCLRRIYKARFGEATRSAAGDRGQTATEGRGQNRPTYFHGPEVVPGKH